MRYGKTDKNTWLYAGDDYYNSSNGLSSSTGFVELFTGAVYALPGLDGESGADGGAGGCYPPIAEYGTTEAGENGADVAFNGTTYKGGGAAARMVKTGTELGITSYMHLHFGGSGGGGAAPGANGGAATPGISGTHGSWVWGGGGKGANALSAEPTVELYGSGGNGGSGGGGGGGAATQHWWNTAYTTLISVYSQTPGAGGKGSAGTKGYRGCIIIYY